MGKQQKRSGAVIAASQRAIFKPRVKDAEGVNTRDATGKTPLFVVSSVDQAEQLIGLGADVRVQDNLDRTLLWAATTPALVKLFIEQGVEVNHKDLYGKTILHYRIPQLEMRDVCLALLELGASLSALDAHGDTPLHVFVKRYGQPTGTVRRLAVLDFLRQVLQFTSVDDTELLEEIAGEAINSDVREVLESRIRVLAPSELDALSEEMVKASVSHRA
jgi:hypothetical protein